ncbi:MAG: DUF1573 domain-containing protein [Flavobacteriales bacterium]|nr:DUF1573 domain-containing protein [Flavobacteriales bacterium]
MNKTILILLLSVIWPSISVYSQNGPKLSFEEFMIDYGTLPYGADGERIWHFKNTGNEPLLITQVKGSCGCTVAKYPKAPIAPGKEAFIKVKYDTKRPGNFAKTVSITTNEKEPGNFHVIKIMGKIEPQANKK